MKLIDTHSHLFTEEFDADRSDVLKRGKANGVEVIYLPNIDESTIERVKGFKSMEGVQIHKMMGLHPSSVKPETFLTELDVIKTELYKGHYKAVGEIGIDLYWDQSTKDIQIEAFIQQCLWAIELNLPVAIHSRESTTLILDIIEQEMALKGLKGVFHCFGAGVDEVNRIKALNMFIGIGGVVTFKKSNLIEVLNEVGLVNVVLETDSPYLAPTPHRGKRNESSYLIHVAQKIAEGLTMDVEQVADITTANAEVLFNG